MHTQYQESFDGVGARDLHYLFLTSCLQVLLEDPSQRIRFCLCCHQSNVVVVVAAAAVAVDVDDDVVVVYIDGVVVVVVATISND